MRIEIDPSARLAAHVDTCRRAVQAQIDAVAAQHGYDGGTSFASYVNDPNPVWAAEAAAFVAWRSAVWQAAFAMMETANPAAPPSLETVLSALPPWSL